jgi:hypothetical protein
MRYLVLVLLISALIIAGLAGENRYQELKRILHSDESANHNLAKRQLFYKCVYYPPPPSPPKPIAV